MSQTTSSAARKIITYLLLYRVITLVHIAFLAGVEIKAVEGLPLLAAAAFNAVVILGRRQLIDTSLRWRHVLLLAVDVAVSFALISSSGGFKSPYYLYNFSPIVLGSFLFGYLGAIVISGVQATSYFIAIYINGKDLPALLIGADHVITDSFFYFATAISVAYLARLQENLDLVERRKNIAVAQVEKMRDVLALRLKERNLSEREIQVLALSLELKTEEQVAQELGVTASTVKTYLRRAYRKLGVKSKQEAMMLALKKENSID